MKSDTPRTDAEWNRLEGQGLCIGHKWHAQELERELNEAKEHIKRTEEEMHRMSMHIHELETELLAGKEEAKP